MNFARGIHMHPRKPGGRSQRRPGLSAAMLVINLVAALAIALHAPGPQSVALGATVLSLMLAALA